MLLSLTLVIAVNIYVSFAGYINYYLTDIVGFGVVIAGSFITIFRIWDAVTDLGAGIAVDRTNTRLGKFRPYMLAGGIGIFVVSHAMIYLPPLLPEGLVRKTVFIVLYMLFVVGQTLITVSVRVIPQLITEDSKQRATMGMISGIFLTVLYSAVPILVYSFIVPRTKGFNLEFFEMLLRVVSLVSLVCTAISFVAIGKYDKKRPEGASEHTARFNLKDAGELLLHNRQFLMLILSAGTDKLASTLQSNATVVVIMFAIVAGNYKLSSATNSYTMIPSILMILLGLGAVGRKFGSRKSMLFSSWGNIVVTVLSILLWIFGNPRTMAFPGYEGFSGWNFFTLAYLVLWCLTKGFGMIATNAINPMLADVIDYEQYRSGRYLPGIITSCFSLADKVISSIGPTVIAILCALIGFSDTLPTIDTPYTVSLFAIGLLGMYGFALLGLIVNVICLRFYDLTPARMEEIHRELQRRQAQEQKTK